jgi:hypothetical protein
MIPRTRGIAIRPAQQRPHWSPRRSPCRQAVPAPAGGAGPQPASRQPARWRAFHPLSWSAPARRTATPAASGTARASAGCRISTAASATPSGKAAIPITVQTKKYPNPTSAVSRPSRLSPAPPTAWPMAWRYLHSLGTRDGSIIATIIRTHIPRNEAAAPGQLCPGIRIHAIDIVQPPGIGIPPISDMDPHQAIVTAVLAAKRSAETPQKARSEDMAQALPYRSWWRHQGLSASLRPLGARSSH